ncbi:MAG: F0F1 ATP synthase subunit [Betaproteobacteria bacterium]|nr:F0F1 ATP synthase subunit [Betaproteobacteria bacterium]
MTPQPDDELRDEVERRADRLDRHERDRGGMLAQTIYIGTLAGLLVLPVVAGAYIGRWLDGMHAGYSVRWTVSLIVLGVVVGAVNVYRFLQDHD